MPLRIAVEVPPVGFPCSMVELANATSLISLLSVAFSFHVPEANVFTPLISCVVLSVT